MLIPVILSGGAGTRLWPVSREAHPKPFIKLADGQSLLQKTYLRAASLPGVEEILTVTQRENYFQTEDEYRGTVGQDAGPKSARLRHQYILEPFGRNTAAAVATAALVTAARHGDQACMLVLPADHVVTDLAAFKKACESAQAAAMGGQLVTFGIRPSAPESGFGYIEFDPASAGGDDRGTGACQAIRFVEKPSPEIARQYLASGRYLWNAGMFCFTAGTMLAELRRHAPELLDAVQHTLACSVTTQGEGLVVLTLDGSAFAGVPDISIDYAVLEKSGKVKVVPCEIGWSDIGSWSALAELQEPDERGNRVAGKKDETLLENVTNCYVQSSGRVIGAVGVADLVIVDTPDALLVAHRDHAQDVRKIVAALKASGNETYKYHRTTHRPWGSYTILEEGSRYKIKRIVVKPNASLSLQKHHHRSEHWVVVSGSALVVNGDQETLVRSNESAYIPIGAKHRLVNPGVIDCVMIEVQVGDYLGEDDIVRFDDTYGRS
ncbi:MAG: mannose-1-phosphate guanylyltransferase/mannose-6-phosphate isomerase [Rhodocyclaceae bacterium]|nr:MAG: mannose-1-phosphate guanylyltransferase/mannose-6-phosphate isomerase [Rhodocyclaceae bacterium]